MRAPFVGLCSFLLAVGTARAASESRSSPDLAGEVRAVFSSAAPTIDGQLDEPMWSGAPVFDRFVLNEPTEGGPGSEKTELRVVFDDDTLYFGFRNFDSQPDRINRSLGRRDTEPASDYVVVFLSPSNDRRTAHRFYLNAGGVQADSLQYDDLHMTQTWDAVWRGAAARFDGGWTAELAIPLYLVGRLDGAQASWQFLARRYIARTHEKVSSVLIPRADNGFVSRFGPMTGVAAIAPRRAIELLPYVAFRGLARPESAASPGSREVLGAGDVGIDAGVILGGGLTLNGTLNPDFGQVEADEIVLNISTFETFFPEKRPFFTQGLDLFQPVGGEDTTSLQNLFHSRRIGSAAPILAAAKLSGSLSPRFSLGLLDAVVTPDRPLHADSAEEIAPGQPATNYLAGAARGVVTGDSWIGARFSAATPLTGECSEMDLAEDPIPDRCRLAGGNAVAVDAHLKSGDGDYAIYGQAAASQAVGGPPERLLLDGTRLERGELGVGGYVRAGKYGGEPLRFQLGYDGESPAFDLNAVGFQRDQNRHSVFASAGWFRPGGLGPLLSFDATMRGTLNYSADGRRLDRGRWLALDVNATTPGFHTLLWENFAGFGEHDLRELRGSGVALLYPSAQLTRITFNSDPTRVVSGRAVGALGHHNSAPREPARFDWTMGAGAAVRPSDAWETRLDVTLDRTLFSPRYIDELEPDRFLLGRLDSMFLSATLKQQWVVTRDFTLQAYLQWFSAYGAYGPFFEGVGDRRDPVTQDDMTPVAAPMISPDFHSAQLAVNAIARWEYRPGSTVYLVYQRNQSERPPDRVDSTLGSDGLFDGPTADLVSIKWTWFWSTL
jgi:hypothetical protein